LVAINFRLNYIVGMRIGNLNLGGILILAPLAGVSNRAFRLLARKYGASLCYTEMISSDAIFHNQGKTMSMVDLKPDEHPVGVQIFGASPEKIAGAIKRLEEMKPDLIDINLGCPVKKVVKKNGGAALLRDMKLAGEIMRAAVENTALPVTIKMRTGWEEDSDVYLEIGKEAEKAGISAITLHPRSRSAGFAGKSDWSKITALKESVSIPVIGNGDITNPQDAADMLAQTGCDAIMIGRAAMKNPAIFRAIGCFLENGILLPPLSIGDKIEIALEHARLIIEQFGEKGGALKMRKHLAWYSKGFPGGAVMRNRLKTVLCYKDIETLLKEFPDNSRVEIDG